MESKIQNRKPVLSAADGSKIPEAAPRIDLKDKVTGQAQYVEDLPDLPNTAYGATLLSPYSHARILRIDATEALNMPGVLGIVDRDHLDGVNPRLKVAPHEHFKLTDDQDFVAIDKVRFDGDLVAVVVAEDLARPSARWKRFTSSTNRCRRSSMPSKRSRPARRFCTKSAAPIFCWRTA